MDGRETRAKHFWIIACIFTLFPIFHTWHFPLKKIVCVCFSQNKSALAFPLPDISTALIPTKVRKASRNVYACTPIKNVFNSAPPLDLYFCSPLHWKSYDLYYARSCTCPQNRTSFVEIIRSVSIGCDCKVRYLNFIILWRSTRVFCVCL